jgi:hypothetical protein
MPRSDFEQTMERIWQSIAETRRGLDEIAAKREERNGPPRPQLTLVRNDDKESDDG